VYSLDRIPVSSVPRATLHTLKPKKSKNLKKLKNLKKSLGFYHPWVYRTCSNEI